MILAFSFYNTSLHNLSLKQKLTEIKHVITNIMLAYLSHSQLLVKYLQLAKKIPLHYFTTEQQNLNLLNLYCSFDI